MRRIIFIPLLVALLAVPFASQAEEDQHPQTVRSSTGSAAGYSSRDATVLSMMGWGLGLGAFIAILTGWLEQDTSSSHSH